MKLYETSFAEKNFQLFYCFYVAALLFMSPRPILGHFLLIFYCFSLRFLIKTARDRKFFAQNCDFLSFWTVIYLSGLKFCPRDGGGATFNFRIILADFHKYTLNMTSYHVTEAINGYF